MSRLSNLPRITLFFTLLLGFQQSVEAQAVPTLQQWQKRAAATADNSKQARQVIIDAVYAGQTVPVALAYEAAMKAKPASQIRIANFAHAAMAAEIHNVENKSNINGILVGDAVKVLKPIIVPNREAKSNQEFQKYLSFKPTKVADAWLSWGHFLARFGDDKTGAIKAYEYSRSLDPTFAEAYLDQVESMRVIDNTLNQSTNAKELQLLDKAERLEPKLHIRVLWCRWAISMDQKKYALATVYLRDYLKLWPNAPGASWLQQDLVKLEAKSMTQ